MKFMQIKPQKARGILKDSMWTDPEWVAEEKFDGDRRIAQFCDPLAKVGQNSRVRFTGTRESVDGTGYVEKTDNLPHLNVAHKSLAGTVLDGEIVAPWAKNFPGGKSKYVTAVMGSSPERAIKLQREKGWLEYMVFDCLWYKGKDVREMRLEQRRELALCAVKAWGNKYAKLVRSTISVGHGDKKPEFERFIKAGKEGVILKHMSHTYGDEKLWVKVKVEWTADVVIMGFEPGKGKYAGSAGAIIMGQYGGQGAAYSKDLFKYGTCRGYTDAQMNAFTKNPKKFIGKVVEIVHNGREPTGAFRHPRFKRSRPDKSAKDCIYREGEI